MARKKKTLKEIKAKLTRQRRAAKTLRICAFAALATLIIFPYLIVYKPPLPTGTHIRTSLIPIDADRTKLLIDSTARDDSSGERTMHQEIFDEILTLIEEADSAILLDFFLWNSWQGMQREEHRSLSSELADALIDKKEDDPGIAIIVMTDPLNRLYGSEEGAVFSRMAKAGIPVVFTDLDLLRDPNTLYAGPARVYGKPISREPWFQKHLKKKRFTHPFYHGGPHVSALQLGNLFFFKANHRKLIVADSAFDGWRMVISSLNPSDSSSAHSNMGVRLDGDIAWRVAREELLAVEWSGGTSGHVLEAGPGDWGKVLRGIRNALPAPRPVEAAEGGQALAEWITEGAIRERVIEMLNGTTRGDHVRIAMFYISDRGVIQAVKDAAFGGARVQLILDMNKDAFGREKDGIPNRPVAGELMSFAAEENVFIDVKWAETHGEQFHSKAMSITNPDAAKHQFTCGSANWTRRNIGDFNMEANICLQNVPEITERFNTYFDNAWRNEGKMLRTLPYEDAALTGSRLALKRATYRIRESTGMCSF